MRNLLLTQRAATDDNKVGGNSLPEIHAAWKRATIDLDKDPRIRDAARGRLAAGNLVNAFVLWCLSRPAEERTAIAIRGLRMLERLKDSPDPVDIERLPLESFAALGMSDDEVREAEPKAKSTAGRDPTRARKARRTG